jgi:hypothetical protein
MVPTPEPRSYPGRAEKPFTVSRALSWVKLTVVLPDAAGEDRIVAVMRRPPANRIDRLRVAVHEYVMRADLRLALCRFKVRQLLLDVGLHLKRRPELAVELYEPPDALKRVSAARRCGMLTRRIEARTPERISEFVDGAHTAHRRSRHSRASAGNQRVRRFVMGCGGIEPPPSGLRVDHLQGFWSVGRTRAREGRRQFESIRMLDLADLH